MYTVKRALIRAVLAGLMVASVSGVSAIEPKKDPLQDLQLTDEQIGKLQDLTLNFARTELEMTDRMATALIDLAKEVDREDRLATEAKAAEAAKIANALIKKISNAYGDILKNRVQYVLDAKDVLTPAQRAQVFAGLDRKVKLPSILIFYDEFDAFRKAIHLDIDQSRKILKYRNDMRRKELELQLAIDLASLDLEAELAKEQPDSEKVNQTVMKIVDAIIQSLDNRVDHFIKAKDVLTAAQKKVLLDAIKAE